MVSLQAMLALGLLAQPLVICQEVGRPELDERDALYLLPTLEGTPLGDGIQAFPTSASVLVPLGEICRLLAFGIEVNAPQGRARGFFISPDRTFTLDMATRTAQTGTQRLPFKEGQVRVWGNDLYVEAPLLEAWFPMTVKVELRDSAIYFTPKEPLPIQVAWDRDRQNARALVSGRGASDRHAPVYPFPYALATLPVMDLAVNWQKSQRAPAAPPSASLALAGDLLWMSSQIYLARDAQGSFRSSRATLFREDPDGTLLGPLHARRFALGDMQQSAALELAGGLPQGRGVLLDNYPTSFRSAFAMRSFRGALPDGWTVELFQNSGLVGFQHARPDGTYEFPSVPLRFGLNLFRMVFHGPQGQQREEAHRIDIDQDQPAPGEFFYRFMGVRPTRPLLADDAAVADPEANRTAMLAEAEYGLSKSFSMKSGFMRVHMPLGSRDYAVAGVRTVLPFLTLQLSGATDRHRGEAVDAAPGLAAEASLRTGFNYSSLQVKHAEFRRGFEPTTMLLAGRLDGLALQKEDAASLFTTIPAWGTPLNLGYLYQGQAFVGEGSLKRHRLQLTAALQRLSVSQSFGYTRDTTRGQNLRQFEGQSLVATYLRDFSLQANFQYQRSEGRLKMGSWALIGNRRAEAGMLYSFGLRGSSGWLKDATYFASALRQTGTFSFGVDLGYSRSGGYSAGVRFQVSVGREPRTGRWLSDAQPMTGMGAVSAQAFADDNYNGTRDPGERALEQVRFRIAESEHPELRPDPTVALYTQISGGRVVEVEVDTSTLEDAAQQPALPAFGILPRPGTFLKLDYPIVVMGEVNGTTRLHRQGENQDMAGLEVELVRANGERVSSQRSAYDGYFEFRELLPGDYLLRVTPRDVGRLGLGRVAERRIHIDRQTSLFDGQDLIVEFENKATPAPPPPDSKPEGPTPAP